MEHDFFFFQLNMDRLDICKAKQYVSSTSFQFHVHIIGVCWMHKQTHSEIPFKYPLLLFPELIFWLSQTVIFGQRH